MTPEAAAARVHHHVCLERRGGATKAAMILLRALERAGAVCSWSYEHPEEPPEGAAAAEPARPGLRLAPGGLGQAPGGLFHLHASRGHLEALRALRPRAGRVVVTAHDCSWLTGGCVFPLDCPALSCGCNNCPRGLPEAAIERERRRQALLDLGPLVLAPSGWMARLMRAAYPQLQVRVAPNAVPLPENMPPRAEAKARLGVAPHARVALFLAHGGLQAGYKGGPHFLEIWGAIKRAAPEAVGFVAGGAQHGRQGDLILWPYLEGEALALVYRAADVLVYPTLADNHPLAVLEAMAFGVAVAAYAVGGIPEQIPDERYGLLVAPGDAAALAGAAARLLSSPALARAIAERAQERCRELFAPDRLARDALRAYASLPG